VIPHQTMFQHQFGYCSRTITLFTTCKKT